MLRRHPTSSTAAESRCPAGGARRLRSVVVLLVCLLTAPAAHAALDLPPLPAVPPGFAIAHVDRQVRIHASPGGAVIAQVGARTEFGSRSTLGVVGSRRNWTRVVSSELANGRTGWIWKPSVRLSHTRVSLMIDLSSRLLRVERRGDVVRRIHVGTGGPGSPTPTGRFALTDKLPGARFGPYYGCCILALSARQPNLPPGWAGGDRIAIHGTDAPETVGAAASAGCLHARDRDLRVLMRLLPLGTPVFIRA